MTVDAWTLEVNEVPWWVILIEGIAAVLLALLLFAAPGATLLALVSITGFFWLVRGIFDIVTIFVDRTAWGWKLFAGILGILAGLVVVQHPLWGSILLPTTAAIIIGIQAILSGGISLVIAFKGGGWGAGIIGALNVFLGIVLLANPLLGGAVLVFVAGGLCLLGGIAAIAIALRVRKAQAG